MANRAEINRMKKKLAESAAQEKPTTAHENSPESQDKEKRALLLRNADQSGESAGNAIARGKARKNILGEEFDFVDVRKIVPSEKNTYSLDKGEIVALASMIYESKHTQPITIRANNGVFEIVDGQRRVEAHNYLAENYGEEWYMIPARVYKPGELDDQKAEFLLHAANVGQRKMTGMERARGVKFIVDTIKSRRPDDPLFTTGWTNDLAAKELGISPRSVATHLNIAANLADEAARAYDEGNLTLVQADKVAKLSEKDQLAVAQAAASLSGKELDLLIEEKRDAQKGKSRTKSEKSAADDLKQAKKAICRALTKEVGSNRAALAEIRSLLFELEVPIAELKDKLDEVEKASQA